MKKENEIKIFEDKRVRTLWDTEQEKWYISIVDVIAILTESVDANAYWRKLKQRLKEEGNERSRLITHEAVFFFRLILYFLIYLFFDVTFSLFQDLKR